MPQLFQVLRCYKCSVFQIHQTKKSNKWQCKMCGEKQSIKRHFGIGNGKECRIHVQKLNAIRGLTEEEKLITIGSENDIDEVKGDNSVKTQLGTESKWSTYIEDREKEDVPQEVNESVYLGNKEVCLEPTKKRKIAAAKRKDLCLLPKETVENRNYCELSYKYECNEENTSTTHQVKNHLKSPKSNSKNIYEIPVDLISNQQNIVHTVVQKSSKWAQFVGTNNEFEQNDESLEVTGSRNSSVQNTQKIFELCNDVDLDTILSI